MLLISGGSGINFSSPVSNTVCTPRTQPNTREYDPKAPPRGPSEGPPYHTVWGWSFEVEALIMSLVDEFRHDTVSPGSNPLKSWRTKDWVSAEGYPFAMLSDPACVGLAWSTANPVGGSNTITWLPYCTEPTINPTSKIQFDGAVSVERTFVRERTGKRQNIQGET
jgi:hypothetical protein